jgi:succinate dehydrogenase / fumarate reductase membrane anchor subunit
MNNGRDFGAIPWLLQRISAGILVVLLIIHFWVGHYANLGASITFAGVQSRLQNALFIVIDSMLLISVVFHGLNGVRNIFLDYPSILTRSRSVSLILLIIGIATVIFGIYSLYPFMAGR